MMTVGGRTGIRVVAAPWRAAMILLVLTGVACAQSRSVVLDENCYWRRYYRFAPSRLSASAMKAEGDKVLGQGRLNRLKQDTERALRAKGVNPATVDWRDHVSLAPGGARAFDPFPTPPSPEGWTEPDFDDASWVRGRGPFQGGLRAQITNPILGQYDGSVDLRLSAACYRARFVVEDPQAARPLTVRLVYSGGARVFVNGREVARGHLPAGNLATDVPGEAYPAQAYGRDAARLGQRTLGPVGIPPSLLREGANVIAVEVRASDFHPIVLTNPIQPNWGGPQRPWPHGRLTSFELGPASVGIPSAAVRPAGVQVWVEDMHHRTCSTDWLPIGEEPGLVRFVGPRNATCSAQVLVGTDVALADLRVTPGDLQRDGAAGGISAFAIQVSHMAPYPLGEWTLRRLGDERGLNAALPSTAQLLQYAASASGRQVSIFDRITGETSVPVAANTCRPVWLSLRIPPEAPPGHYGGQIAVSAEGMEAVRLPVELDVVDWRLPDPKDFQTFVGCEENPYGVAKQYGVPLWSDRHFALLEASFRQLGRAGNRWLNVPVLARTEFGNGYDSMIRWLRTSSGGLAFDFGILDRYLDLAVKHWGQPRVVQFAVMQGMRSPADPPQVSVLDEATGQHFLYTVGPVAQQGQSGGPAPLTAQQRRAWTLFATALCGHMKARGLEKAMCWGYPLEQEADPSLKTQLASCAPGVHWVAGPHEMMSNGVYAKDENFYGIVADIRYHGGWGSFRDDQGWKSRTLHLANPRVGGTSFALHTTSYPFAYRVMVDRALATGRGGFTRVGADEWAGIHYEGMAVPKWLTGVPVLFTLWPGRDGAESSARFEALIEGIQETEARIFLEQALDGGGVPADVAARTRKILADHFDETDFFLGNSIIHDMEQYHYGWQERSRRLYRAAAEVSGLTGGQRG